jgi:hypothetical protein
MEPAKFPAQQRTNVVGVPSGASATLSARSFLAE